MADEADGQVAAAGARGWCGTLEVAETVVMLAAGAAILVVALRGSFSGGVRPPATTRTLAVPVAPVSIDGAPRRGSATARLALIEHSDFECPFCAKFERETLPALIKQYVDPGRVLFVFRDALIPTHAEARPAAEAAACAQAQGQFWAAHDAFFGAQEHLKDTIATLPMTLHLAAAPFATCLAKDAAAKVDADVVLSKQLGVTGTPAFFVGIVQADGRIQVKRTIVGAEPLTDFQRALDAALQDAPVATTAAGR